MDKKAIIAVGLSNGDEGKGTVVAALTEQHNAHTVVRFNGGAQAAHNVVTSDGRHHTFAQFGSGTFTPGVHTYHSEMVLLAPTAMLNEAAHLDYLGVSDALTRTYINENAIIISPYHKLMNQMKERARGDARHGSCGMGIGEAMMDFVHGDENYIIRAKDLNNEAVLRDKLEHIQYVKYNECKYSVEDGGPPLDYHEITGLWRDSAFWERWIIGCSLIADNAHIVEGANYEKSLFGMDGTVVFEGSQGVLLDEWHGFHPYTTWSTTTTKNAEEILARNNYSGDVTKLGILRAYATRHGAGPLPTEDEALTNLLTEPHNKNGEWQGKFRFGWFDAVMSRYAIDCCGGIDELAITHLDELEKQEEWKICFGYKTYDYGLTFMEYLQYRTEHDLDWREQVTNSLRHYEPQYIGVENNADEYCQMIVGELDVPITMHSWGAETNAKAHCPLEERAYYAIR